MLTELKSGKLLIEGAQWDGQIVTVFGAVAIDIQKERSIIVVSRNGDKK